jgi:glycosyltransferase involved in cell wall biosynthesis
MNWIVTELFYPDEISTALIMTEIAEEIAKSGEVSVICGPVGYEKSYTAQQKALSNNIKISRVTIAALNKNKLLSRILRLLFLSVKMSYRVLISVKKNDHVIIVTNPAFLILVVSFIKKFRKFKLSILVHDVFPENLVPANILSDKSLKYKMLKGIYDNAYRKADKLIVLGNDMKALMIKKLVHKIPSIDVVTNWADEDIYPLESFNKSAYLGIDVSAKVVIGFAGNIGRLQALPEFLDAFKSAGNENIVLVLVGDGALKNEVTNFIEKAELKNVVLPGSKPRAEQNLFLNACDIGLITLKKGMRGLGVPSKTYNIMAAGKPLLYIGDKNSEVDEYIKEYACGWSFYCDERTELINFLSALRPDNKDMLNIKGQNANKTVCRFFKKKDVLHKFKNLV